MSGLLAAVLVAGAHLVGAGWIGGALLAFFAGSGSLMTLWLDPDGGREVRRGADQVLANGGPAALAALLIPVQPALGWPLLTGALATATADTWATEVGRTARAVPRDVLTWHPVPAGTSGGITARGTLAGVIGAASLACIAWGLGVSGSIAMAGAVGGTLGMMTDSVLGSSLQTRYLCTVCGTPTERRRHCEAPARRQRGLPGLDNSGVNAVSTALGGLAALALAWWCC